MRLGGVQLQRLPEDFSGEISVSDPDDVEVMMTDVLRLRSLGIPDREIIKRLVQAGWSEGLSEWLLTRMEVVGNPISMCLPSGRTLHPRTVEVPDALVDEFLNLPPEILEQARTIVAKKVSLRPASGQGDPIPPVAGISSEFVTWLVQVVKVRGPDIFPIAISPTVAKARALFGHEYAAKTKFVRRAWRYLIVGILINLMSTVAFTQEESPILLLIGGVLALSLQVRGAWLLAMAKGYSGWSGLLVLFCTIPYLVWYFLLAEDKLPASPSGNSNENPPTGWQR
ncbi:MAG: hypothetical protein KJZ62_05530 [Fimbriimonadaceae bacterium]|nr:hypothetical protein [Fimbriimonadaceae bacterium]QOJ12090.1 MAG: hypothetical protein HRU74_08520 [Chthonomonadaceae bacterium]